MRLALALAALLATASGCSATVIRNDPGGRMIDYAIKVRKADSVRVDGWCASACTLYLAHPNVCITPRARFAFHKPYGASPAENAKALAWMMKQYPQWVREWIDANGGLTTELIVMPYGTAVHHIRQCDG